MNLLLKFFISSAIFFGGTYISYAQDKWEKPLEQDNNFVIGKLQNGMNYYIRKHNNPSKHAEFFIIHNVGSLQEEENQRGLAHFLEHMAFNGTQNFPDKLLLNYLNSIGVKFGRNVNAYTSMDRTVYNISQVPLQRENVVDSVLLMLHDWSYYITCDSLAIENERGVVREEWRRGDDARTRMMKAFFAIEQKGSRFAERSPIGLPQVINTFKPSTLINFYHNWYRPDLQAVVVVGDVDPKQIEEKITKIFSSIPNSANKPAKEVYSIPVNDKLETVYYSDPELSAASVRILAKYPSISAKDKGTLNFIKENLMSEMMVEALRTRINNQVKNNKKSLYKTAIPTFGEIYYATRIFRLTAVQNGKDFNSALQGLLTDYIAFYKNGFTPSEFDLVIAAKSADLKKKKMRNVNPKNEDYVSAVVETFTRGNALVDVAKVNDLSIEVLDQITLDEFNNFIKSNFENVYPTIVFAGSDKDSLIFTPKERVNFLYDSLKSADINVKLYEAKNDLKINDKLENKSLSYIGPYAKMEEVKEYKLQNGNTVLFINNSNVKDYIKFTAVKKGGFSLFKDDEVFNARLTKMYQPNILINGMDKNTFANYTKSNLFRISPSITDRYNYISGFFDKTKIEPFFKALYLLSKDVSVDDNDLKRFKEQLIKQQEKHTPIQIFKDSCKVLSYEKTLLNVKIPLENIKNITSNDILESYNDAFCNFDGYTYIIEGDIDFSLLEPYLEKYLSNIASKSAGTIKQNYRESNWYKKDINLRYKSNSLVSSKASVGCSIKGYVPYNDKSFIYANFIEDILRERYMNKIREEKGGTYTIGVSAEFSLYPKSSLVLDVNFDTDPKLVDELVECVWDELEMLAKQGPTIDEIERIKLFLNKKIKFVDDYKMQYSDKIISQILGYPYINSRNIDIINSVTPKIIKDFIKSITKQGNFSTFILEP